MYSFYYRIYKSKFVNYTFSFLLKNIVRTRKQAEEDVHDIHCSRERSRAAWKIIEQYLMHFVEKECYQISTRCRLHPDKDLFRDQEHHKFHVDINELLLELLSWV
ncbi:hypothetical protein Patl1_10671 [Pistacia atlantica]|uniref:Uncharacterized protein n=1 Tax=Pistacia atlantica TaxID=434234 RepID=A0ACC1A765_9ROSI|nr:hypothetical protein Patl1_10671 [Pistacia atlantica]